MMNSRKKEIAEIDTVGDLTSTGNFLNSCCIILKLTELTLRDDYRKDQSKERHHKSSRKSKSKKEKKRRHRSRSRSKSRDRESRDSRTNKDNRRSRKRSHSSSTPSPPVANINKDLRPEDSSVRNLNNIVIPSHPPPLIPNYQSRLISAKANIKVIIFLIFLLLAISINR